MSLSDAKLRNLKPAEKPFKTADGEGLYIVTNPNGSKLWRMGYRFGGKERVLSFGAYPHVTLLEARIKRGEAKKLLADGVDPGRVAKIEKAEAKEQNAASFKVVADRWMKAHQDRWVSSYAVRLRSRMVEDVYPYIGSVPIADIRPREVLEVIRRVEDRGAVEMARRIYQMVGAVFKFAVGEALIESDPTRDIGKALAPARPPKHRTAPQEAHLGKLQLDIETYQGEAITKLGLTLVLHTFVRTQEIRFAKWDEFSDLDGDNPLWSIDAERMKMRRDHIVPLTQQAVAVLRALRKAGGGSEWLLPSPIQHLNKPISENTLIYALYKMGYHSKATVHGFRATASTILNEREFNKDHIELQLAHVDHSIRGVYNAAKWLKQRRAMMDWWSNFLDGKLSEARDKAMFEGIKDKAEVNTLVDRMFADLLG